MKVAVRLRSLGEQADGRSWSSHAGSYHGFLKRRKNRLERHRAKKDPECVAAYKKYRGYET